MAIPVQLLRADKNDPSKTLTRGDIVKLTGIPTEAFNSAARRGHLPILDALEYRKSSVVATEDRHGWRRFSAFDALLVLVARDLSTGNSSFGAMDFPAASRIIGNACGDIIDALNNTADEDVFVGYAWSDEGGMSVAGTLSEIVTSIRQSVAHDKQYGRRNGVRHLTLANVSACYRLLRARAAEHGIDVSAEFWAAN